jgi:hypothetical protein
MSFLPWRKHTLFALKMTMSVKKFRNFFIMIIMHIKLYTVGQIQYIVLFSTGASCMHTDGEVFINSLCNTMMTRRIPSNPSRVT